MLPSCVLPITLSGCTPITLDARFLLLQASCLPPAWAATILSFTPRAPPSPLVHPAAGHAQGGPGREHPPDARDRQCRRLGAPHRRQAARPRDGCVAGSGFSRPAENSLSAGCDSSCTDCGKLRTASGCWLLSALESQGKSSKRVLPGALAPCAEVTQRDLEAVAQQVWAGAVCDGAACAPVGDAVSAVHHQHRLPAPAPLALAACHAQSTPQPHLRLYRPRVSPTPPPGCGRAAEEGERRRQLLAQPLCQGRGAAAGEAGPVAQQHACLVCPRAHLNCPARQARQPSLLPSLGALVQVFVQQKVMDLTGLDAQLVVQVGAAQL